MQINSHSSYCYATAKICTVNTNALARFKIESYSSLGLAIIASLALILAIGSGIAIFRWGCQLYSQANYWTPAAAMQCGVGLGLGCLSPLLLKMVVEELRKAFKKSDPSSTAQDPPKKKGVN